VPREHETLTIVDGQVGDRGVIERVEEDGREESVEEPVGALVYVDLLVADVRGEVRKEVIGELTNFVGWNIVGGKKHGLGHVVR